MKTKNKKLPKNIKLCLFDFLSEDTKDKIFDELNEHLANTYGYCNRGFGYDEEMTIENIEWDTEE